MPKKQLKNSPSLAFVYMMLAAYVGMMLAVFTLNVKFSAAIATIIAMAPLWEDIRTMTAGQKILFIRTAPPPEQ